MTESMAKMIFFATMFSSFCSLARWELGFPGGSDGKAFTYNPADLSSVSGLGRSPGGGHGNPHQFSCLENPHGQRSLAGCKELDTTGRLSTAQHIRKQINLKRDVKERCVCVCVYVCVCVCVCVCVWDWLIHWLVREHFSPSRVVRCRIWRLLESRATFASILKDPGTGHSVHHQNPRGEPLQP